MDEEHTMQFRHRIGYFLEFPEPITIENKGHINILTIFHFQLNNRKYTSKQMNTH